MTYRDNPLIARKYKSKRWQQVRKLKILQCPFCERCLEKGIYNSTYIVHHKDYITNLNYEDDNVFYNLDNLESLCLDCHNKEHFGDKKEYTFDSKGNVIKKIFN